jgi:hypothetical protein
LRIEARSGTEKGGHLGDAAHVIGRLPGSSLDGVADEVDRLLLGLEKLLLQPALLCAPSQCAPPRQGV